MHVDTLLAVLDLSSHLMEIEMQAYKDLKMGPINQAVGHLPG